MLMKNIVSLVFICVCVLIQTCDVFGDQAEYLKQDIVQEANELLPIGSNIRYYCPLCRDTAYKEVSILWKKIVRCSDNKEDQFYQYHKILINNLPRLDLAYTYILVDEEWVNLALRLKLNVHGVPYTLPSDLPGHSLTANEQIDGASWAIPFHNDEIETSPETRLEAFQQTVIHTLDQRYHTPVQTTEPVYYVPHVPLVFVTFEFEKTRRYGFSWQEDNTLYFTMLYDTPVDDEFLNLCNAGGDLITDVTPQSVVPEEPPLIGVYRHDFWRAWYVLFAKDAKRFRDVWSISPWTSVKGGYTEGKTFEFSDVDGDGVHEIKVMIELCENCWSDELVITRSRELYDWNGETYELMQSEEISDNE